MTASAVEGSGQMPVVESGKCFDLFSAEKGDLAVLTREGNTHHQLDSLLVDRHLLHHLPLLSTLRMVRWP